MPSLKVQAVQVNSALSLQVKQMHKKLDNKTKLLLKEAEMLVLVLVLLVLVHLANLALSLQVKQMHKKLDNEMLALHNKAATLEMVNSAKANKRILTLGGAHTRY